MIAAIFAATAIVMGQVALPVQEKTTVMAAALRDPESIERAELEFGRGFAPEAIRIIDLAIDDESQAKDPDPALLANLYNCRAWMTLKSLDTTPLDRQKNLRNAEAYAARAAEIVGASELYWHDYAAIRIRRALEERQLQSVESRIPEYVWSRRDVRQPLRTIDSRVQFKNAVDRCLLETSGDIDASTTPDTSSERTEIPINTSEQLIDTILRERPVDWAAWADVWHVARSQRGG